MKNYLFLIFYSLVLHTNLFAQWLPVSGIEGAISYDIVKTNTCVFMNSSGLGIVSQHLDSVNWTIVYPHKVWSLMSSGDVLIAHSTSNAGGTSKLIRSFDEGATWDTVSLESYSTAFAIADTTLFAWRSTINDNGIFISKNYGTDWEKAVNLDENSMCDLYSDDFNLYYWIYQGSLQLYFSEDQGNSFDSISLPDQIAYTSAIKAVQKSDTCLFLIADSIFRYSYVNQTWYAYSNVNRLVSFKYHNNILYGCGNGIFQFEPEADQWIPCDSGLMPEQANKIVFVNEQGFCSNSFGCYKTDSSFIWHSNISGLNGANIYHVAARENEVWACTSMGLFKSLDAGITFSLLLSQVPDSYYKIIVTDSLYFLSTGNGISISTDYGNNWVNYPMDVLPTYSSISDFDIGSQYIFALLWSNSGETLYRTKYFPIAWNAVAGSEISFAKYIAVHDSIVIVSKSSSSNQPYPVYISNNNGEELTPASFLQQAYVVKVKYEGDKFVALTGNRIYYSGDNGATWENMLVSDPEFVLSDVSIHNGVTIASGWFYGYLPKAYATYNNGLSWADIAGNLSDPLAHVFTCSMISENRTFIGTYCKGLWYRDDIITSFPEHQPCKGNSIRILPNPTGKLFKVQYYSEKSSATMILITDMNGKVLYSNEKVSINKGENQLLVDAGNLPDGLYLVTLSIGNIRLSSKLIINN